jgi:hypothetical protein
MPKYVIENFADCPVYRWQEVGGILEVLKDQVVNRPGWESDILFV